MVQGLKYAAAFFVFALLTNTVRGQESISEALDKCARSWKPFIADVQETVRGTGPDAKNGKNGQFSWGDRDSERTYSVTYANGNFKYFCSSINGRDDSSKNSWAETIIGKDGSFEQYDGQGRISSTNRTTLQIELFGPFWKSLPLCDRIRETPDLHVVRDSNLTIVKGTIPTMGADSELRIDNQGQVIQAICPGVQVTLSDYQNVDGFRLPTLITKSVNAVGVRSMTKYRLSNIRLLPQDTTLKMVWKPGTYIKDAINGRFFYTDKDGRLFRNYSWEASSTRLKAQRSLGFLIFITLGTIIIAGFIIRRARASTGRQ